MSSISRVCDVNGCDLKHFAKGYCRGHWRRLQLYGDPTVVIREQHRKRKSSEYTVWVRMRDRCYNPESKYYHYYGGRGIKVCDEWKNSFQTFLDEMGERPSPFYTLDRIDIDGDYEWMNCRWTTKTNQTINRRKFKNNTSGYRGVSYHKLIKRWAVQIAINNKGYYFGGFDTALEAAYVYDQVAMQLHRHEAKLNFEY